MEARVIGLEKLGKHDVELVGGKNSSLGEMISHLSNAGVSVPGGFATTAQAYREFLEQSGLNAKINAELKVLNVDDVNALAETGAKIRQWIVDTPLTAELEQEVRKAFAELSNGNPDIAVAVRSSATAEDLPDASFAGQQETFLNIRGIDNVLIAIKEVFASLYNDRAISYRVHQNFAHDVVALSAGIQRMVRSETGAEFYLSKPLLNAGKHAVLRRNLGSKHQKMIYGEEASAGKSVVVVDVEKQERQQFALNDHELQELAKQALIIENHYGSPMDIEWAKDGDDGQIYIVQARPETVKSQSKGKAEQRYKLKGSGTVLAEGRAIGLKAVQSVNVSVLVKYVLLRLLKKWTKYKTVTCLYLT